MFEKYKLKRKQKRLDYLDKEMEDYRDYMKHLAVSFGFERDYRSGVLIYKITDETLIVLRENHYMPWFEITIVGENCDGIHVPILNIRLSANLCKKVIDHYEEDIEPLDIYELNPNVAWRREAQSSPLRHRSERDKLREELENE